MVECKNQSMEQAFLHIISYLPFSDTLAYYYNNTGHSGMGGYNTLTLLGLGLVLLAGLVGGIVQSRMMAAMKEFSATPAPYNGADVARAMLRDNGIGGVQVTHTPGQLTDHYNPANRTVNLSDDVYATYSVAAMDVAAHECGHAVQHAKAYPWLSLRSELVPIVSLGSKLGQIVLVVGLILLAAGSSTTVAWIGLAMFATTTVFTLVTLPVEFDASRRALQWLEASGVADRAMHGQAQTALRWAAMTYVAAALSSIAMLVYYLFIILSHTQNRNN